VTSIFGSFETPRPSSITEVLHLGNLADDATGLTFEQLRAIYRYARNENGKRELFVGDPTFMKGWINLDAPAAQALISVIIALDDDETVKQARRAAKNILEGQPWNDALGFASPPVKALIKIHGAKWGLRFQSADPTMRGRELINEDLPPIPGGQPEPTAPSETTTSEEPAAVQNARDVLRAGGLPA
jgi:hypothetical protein